MTRKRSSLRSEPNDQYQSQLSQASDDEFDAEISEGDDFSNFNKRVKSVSSPYSSLSLLSYLLFYSLINNKHKTHCLIFQYSLEL